MVIVTNAGANANDAAVRKFGIEICPQGVVVDGTTIDTSERVPFAVADEWVKSSADHPHVLGTTAKEFAAVLGRVAQTDREIVVVQGSRKLVQSYQSAVSAAKMLQEHPRYRDVRIAVIDTRATDAAVGLIAVLTALAAASGLDFDETVHVAERGVEQLHVLATVRTFDYLVKGGRASFLKARLADFLRVRPLLGLVDGEVAPVGRMAKGADPAQKMAEHLTARIAARRPVWAAVAHGGDLEAAERMLELLRARLDVRWGFTTPLSVTAYLNSGPGSLAAGLLCLDELPWNPPAPLGEV